MNGRVQRALLLSSLLLAAMPLTPAEAGGGCHSGDSDNLTATVAGTEVGLKRNCFLPSVLAVDEGGTVRFTNHDEVKHVVIGTQWGLTGDLEPGDTAERRFDRRGTYPYSCYLHPGMNGVILVGDAAPAAAAPISPGPTTLAASTSTDDSDLPALAIGALAGLVLGSAAARGRLRSLLRR